MRAAFSAPYEVILRGHADFDAAREGQVAPVVDAAKPDVVINAIALQGIDYCEEHRDEAFRINTEFPAELATLAARDNFLLIHFSTESVFSDRAEGAYGEEDAPAPLNVYGESKLEGERRIRDLAPHHYLVRLALQFGTGGKGGQFVERMIALAGQGTTVQVADDVVTSPSYSTDVACELRRIIEAELPYGVYHIANEGIASLHRLMEEVLCRLGLQAALERASHVDFPTVGRKNLRTPLRSSKLPPLRPWEEAVEEWVGGGRISKQ